MKESMQRITILVLVVMLAVGIWLYAEQASQWKKTEDTIKAMNAFIVKQTLGQRDMDQRLIRMIADNKLRATDGDKRLQKLMSEFGIRLSALEHAKTIKPCPQHKAIMPIPPPQPIIPKGG
jgi:hypothetical protein